MKRRLSPFMFEFTIDENDVQNVFRARLTYGTARASSSWGYRCSWGMTLYVGGEALLVPRRLKY